MLIPLDHTKRFSRLLKKPLSMISALVLGTAINQQVYAQSCTGAADIWFANDESGSVVDVEMTYALDFLYKVSDEFLFEEQEGAKAAVFGWADSVPTVDYVLPASAEFGDPDDSGYLDPNLDNDNSDSTIVTDGDGQGVRELYAARTYSAGTWLAKATNELALRIGDNTDTDSDGTTDNGRRTGIPQIAVLLTDAMANQMTNAGSGGSAGQAGGADWDTAISNLVATAGGTEMVLMLIDVAAVAYGEPGAGNEATAGNPATRTLIDSFITNYGISLFVGDTYADIADPVNSYISGLTDAICNVTDVVLRITNVPPTFNDVSTFTVTFEFSADVTGFTVGEVTVGNGTASNLVQLSPSTYTVDITPDGSNLDITVDVAAAVAQTAGGRNNRPAQQAVIQYDTDGDGIGDVDEGTTTDTDGDGVFDYLDLDSDNDGIPDAIENTATGSVDTDGDGVPDYLDLDSDADGILDIVENGSATALSLDTDGDGQINLTENFGTDGLADALQSSGDGGALNYTIADTDGDGVDDFRDLDSDNDSLSDLVESGLDAATIASLDADSDGDIDTPTENVANVVGGDGILDSLQGGTDGNPLTFSVADTDGDAIYDFRDLDTDGDGIPDLIEGGNTAAIALDVDADGFIDPAETAVGSDGIADTAQGGSDGGALPAATNSDAANETGVAIPDFRDLDSDNDGLTDVQEAGGVDFDLDAFADGTDGDGDGIIDSGYTYNPIDTAPTDAPDYQNVDSNGGGTGDDNDSDPTLSAFDSSPDDGVIDDTTDSDGDGIPDVVDDFNGPGVNPLAEIVVTETGGLTQVTELGAGNTDTFDVILRAQPSADVVVLVTSPDSGEATPAPATLTFTSANWNSAQTVTVTGHDDDLVDGDQTFALSLVVDTANSAAEYNGLSAAVTSTVIDATADDDGDGLSNALEGSGDSDGDGLPDSNDPDSDNDGIPDTQEAGSDSANPVDSDGDGQPDYLDLDSDNDGIVDYLETGSSPAIPDDTDSDGIPDYLDLDSDGDGIPDALEDSNSPALSDIDSVGPASGGGNGIDDAIDALATGGNDTNLDGIDDTLEPSDTDADGTDNHRDLDSDGDGILDIIEADNMPPLTGTDSDADGIDDALDDDETGGTDNDGDGVDDALAPRDTDGDGVPDFADLDSDNDGIPDALEGFTSAPVYSGLDSDGDGIDDALDADNGGPVTDANGNGISDVFEPLDTDGDGVPDYRDLDSDNDSLPDVTEAGGSDENGDGLIDSLADQGTSTNLPDTDGDGLPDQQDVESTNPANDGSGPFDVDNNPEAVGSDTSPRDGIVDDATDSDGDGIADVVDRAPNGFGLDPAVISPDSDGDGVIDAIDLDDDNDGIPDTTEGYDADDPAASTDSDGDGVPDYLDLDSDNDGLYDLVEAFDTVSDFDGDGRIDGFTDLEPVGAVDGLHDAIDVAMVPVDTDGDGLADFRDLDSDNDSLSDLLEAVGDLQESALLDTNGNGQVDLLDAVTGLPLDANNNPLTFTTIDSDGDGKPNFRDLDSDNDGFDDGLEGVDSDSNGVLDSNEGGSGDLETSVSGSGAMNAWFVLLIAALLMQSRYPRAKFTRILPGFLMVLASVGQAQADTLCATTTQEGDQSVFHGCWYAGFGIGKSQVDPEGSSNGWKTDDDSSAGLEFTVGKHLKPNWFAEFKYADMGSAGLKNRNPAIDEAYPKAQIYYKVPSIMAGYLLFEEQHWFNPYVKLGVAAIQNGEENSGGTVSYDEVTGVQAVLGFGVQLTERNKPAFARFNFDAYDRDAWFVSFSVNYLFGGKP